VVVAVSVAILGAGAVGGMLGVLLAKAGHDVTVLASERTSTAININGLVLHSAHYGEWHVRVPARPWLTAPVDILFVTVKAPDLLAALTRVPGPLLHNTAVVPLLNGVEHVPLLRAVFPKAVVVPMTVAVEATRLEPGVVEHLSPFADYAICAGLPEQVNDPAMLLRSAGLDVDSSAPNEATLLWRKLCLLAPLALLTTAARDALGPAREARPDLLDALVDETAAAAEAHGVEIDRATTAARLRSLPGALRSSMLKDALAGASLELDAIAGPVLRAAPNGAPVTRGVVAEITRIASFHT
jgi:2-dehydropantoate 2-reductase